jgi:hypothetical protein
MHMSELSRRTHILLDEDRYRRLERRARDTGASVGALIREAIDVVYPGVPTDRARAATRFLAVEPFIEVGDWATFKEQMLDEMSGKPAE